MATYGIKSGRTLVGPSRRPLSGGPATTVIVRYGPYR